MAEWTKARVTINESAPVVGRSAIEIAANPEVAWNVLTAIGRWPDWNPAVKSVPFEEGIDEGSEFRWKAGPGTIWSTIPERRCSVANRLDGLHLGNQGHPRAHARAARRRNVGQDGRVI